MAKKAIKKKDKKPKKKMGRNLIKIDWEEVKRLLVAGCSGVQIAGSLGFSHETLYERCLTDLGKTFTLFSSENRLKGDNFLRSKQMQVAGKGNTTMLVWLGKQRLGQRDVPQETHKFNGKLIELLDSLKNVDKQADFNKEEKA